MTHFTLKKKAHTRFALVADLRRFSRGDHPARLAG